ncbi:acetate/propionate family kinase [Roseateles sp.]|uniref:acetate/propionate family kinase n=1 Tax=Roseateles sp. TaxID=1971397 RepID=UPI0032640024
MQTTHPVILTLNGGSSSIRFSLYRLGDKLERLRHGKLERIGMGYSRMGFSAADGRWVETPSSATDYRSATGELMDCLAAENLLHTVSAVGHRVVHGMGHTEPQAVTPELMADLARVVDVDPNHLPGEIELMQACSQRLAHIPQVACFDTAFHHQMPAVARLMAVPRRLQALGVQRYGFHGLSYAYLLEELARTAGTDAAAGRVILAHLGNGASMTAVLNGHSIDTSMGFTPASGLPMGTRSGDIDPGLALYLQRTQHMTPSHFDAMVNQESGLLGLSETSADMRDLLASEASDPRAAEAVALFCYQAKKLVGSYAAALGGLDTLVFAGGIGENAALVRARICEGLGFLDLKLDEARNAAHADLISADLSRVQVRVIRTNEALMLARSVCRVLGYSSQPDKAQA